MHCLRPCSFCQGRGHTTPICAVLKRIDQDESIVGRGSSISVIQERRSIDRRKMLAKGSEREELRGKPRYCKRRQTQSHSTLGDLEKQICCKEMMKQFNKITSPLSYNPQVRRVRRSSSLESITTQLFRFFLNLFLNEFRNEKDDCLV